MSEITEISSVLAELHKQVLAEMVSEIDAENTSYEPENDRLENLKKENYVLLQEKIKPAKSNFSLEDAIESWHKKRAFKYRTERKEVKQSEDDWRFYYSSFCSFAPLQYRDQKHQELLKADFYKRYFDFDLDWQQSDFYKKLLADFVSQYIINGENNYGYYIVGEVGVGKTTLITAIARVLITFLVINVRYITMPRLVRLITSIAEYDKQKVSELEKCDLLFIDDFAHENYSTDNQEAVIRDFFSYRYGNNLLNIISGNIDIRSQAETNSFNRQMADYLNDSKYYKIVEMSGKSKRI